MRVSFLIDGFNVYHSAKALQRDLGDPPKATRWLDLHALCVSCMPNFGRESILQDITYFSAYAHHIRQPDVVARHQDYVRCLNATGVRAQMARFKKKHIFCKNCKKRFVSYEEKETDVSIALALIEKLLKDEADIAVILSGDTDLGPAASTAARLFPAKRVYFGFPYKRENSELRVIAPGSFKIRAPKYLQNQLPDPFVLPDGKQIAKPPTW